MSNCREKMSATTGNFSESLDRMSDSTPCRLCMKKNDYYYNIFTSLVASQITVEDALYYLVDLKVAVGDGLPTNLCPLCLKKLIELNDFRNICHKSDAELRNVSSRNFFKSVEGEEAADDNLRSSPETKDCIRDVIVGTSEVACSVQPTEIFIPVPDLQLPTNNMSCHVKVENEDLLREGNFVVQQTPAQNGIESNAIDPLASDDLFRVKEENVDPLREENGVVLHGAAPDGFESDAIDPLTTDAVFHVKEEDEDHFGEESYPVMHTTDPAGTLSDISYPLATGDYSTSDEDGEPIESLTIAHKSTAMASVTNAEKAAVLLSHVENLQPRDMHPMVPVYHGFHVMIKKIDKIECLSRAKNNPGRLQRLLLEKIKGREYIKTHCARGQRATTGGLPAADADVLSAVQLYTESLFKGQKVPSIEKTFNQMSGNIRRHDRYCEGKYRYARKQKKNKNVGDENLRQLHEYGEMSTPLSEAFAYIHGKNHIHATIVKRLSQERASY